MRLGVIVPSVNTVLEPELYMMKPGDITLHFSRTRYIYTGAHDTAEPLIGMAAGAKDAARQLADAGVGAIGYGSTGGSFFSGPDYHLELARKLQDVAGVACTTASTAVIEALRELGVRRVAVVTPYVEMDNERERALLLHAGFEVAHLVGLGVHDGGAIRDVPLSETRRLALTCKDVVADACFISCTNLKSAPLIAELEEQLDKPVVTSNQALLWHLLRLAGVSTPISGFGRLLERNGCLGRCAFDPL